MMTREEVAATPASSSDTAGAKAEMFSPLPLSREFVERTTTSVESEPPVLGAAIAATPAPRRSLEVMQAVSDLNSRHAAVRAPAPSVADDRKE